jgi:hypothetical protein
MSHHCDGLRLKEISLTVAQQAVIEFAYAVRMLVEPLAKSQEKLYFEEANCLTSVFYQVRKFLKEVDPSYLALHRGVVDFYEKKRELDNTWDRLRWVPDEKEEEKEIVCQDKPTCRFVSECTRGWDAIDPQTGRLCHDGLKRNFEKVLRRW